MSTIVLAARQSWPSTTLQFTWDSEFQLMWGQTGQLVPGVTFEAAQAIPASPSDQNEATLTYQNGAFQLQNLTHALLPSGAMAVVADATIPFGQAAIALGISGSPVFAVPASPNINNLFPTTGSQVWLTAGEYQQGQVLDPDEITNRVQVQFPPGVFHMTATLNQDNTWTLSPG